MPGPYALTLERRLCSGVDLVAFLEWSLDAILHLFNIRLNRHENSIYYCRDESDNLGHLSIKYRAIIKLYDLAEDADPAPVY
jgi:hypothetical protein